ncbi:hypothetical protein ACHHYP_01774 [Achlya hypogyna]|uniref:Uncharacterized protein n=1 Tax=Achlya hypogyna TaxID=1202772 RepID=A0A1V9ZT57_ACHHY|nr:hypothetical protein ACHHYP_01774 [Achlya hypogyna]
MPSHIMRLNSILDDSSSYFDLDHTEHSKSAVACEFCVVKDPSLLEKLMVVPKNQVQVLVRIDDGSMSMTTNDGDRISVATHDLWVQLRGKREVWMGSKSSDDSPKHHTTLAFESRIAAVEFCAAVDLVQHIGHLRHPGKLPFPAANDAVLRRHLQSMLKFVEEMWVLAQWRELWPYSNMTEIIHDALEALDAAETAGDVAAMRTPLAELYNTFYAQANITFFAERDDIRYYRPSYIGLLVAKLKALLSHLAFYLR